LAGVRISLTLRRGSLAALAGLASVVLAPSQAQAGVLTVPMAVTAAFAVGCDASPAPISTWTAPVLAPASKASALLGGASSELDRIRMEQDRQLAPAEASPATIAMAEQPVPPLAPAAGPTLQNAACLQWLQPQPAAALVPQRPLASPGDVLGTKRLAIGHTMFDRDWARVEHDGISRMRSRQVLGSAPLATEVALERVNAWVNHHVTYVEDQALFGRADYWAGASRTLWLGKGDCEDIALTKMQLLAAAGIPRDDMMLTIARDLVRGADHALLMVKLGERYVMLDDSTDRVIDATEANDYRPVLSFAPGHAWLHGYQTASADLSAR
jgi:predicted transglutaminase-like cysteine proteinase